MSGRKLNKIQNYNDPPARIAAKLLKSLHASRTNIITTHKRDDAMKNYMTAVLAFLVLMGGSVHAEYAEEKAKVAPPPNEMLEGATMEKLAKLGAASEQHRILETLAGAWNFDLKYWTNKDAEPQLSTGTVTNEMILGNRFLSGKIAMILNIGGENIHYEGWNIQGYDTIKKAYTSVLIDKIHTGVTTGAGQYNEKLKTLEEKGHFTHPLMDKEGTYRSELQFTKDDAYKQTVFIAGKSGKEYKVLEIDFSKQ